ncbi:type II toxin-antitoxin system RelE/ParE family toxin [Brucella intermedia]|uniref:type II toxin-antitoxin system RelE/ParE family toxin n=1 Tax=Brucella intermedia TaxID=94625 RepID=UPI00046A7679|nr:type II toxin-antitoxin system RelE/ParE family toxin [Brucella intermedia]
MKLVWLARARANRTDAIAYIAGKNPRAALDQLDEIERQTDMLMDYPDMGRVGRKRGTRELVVNRTPFIIVYRLRPRAQRIEILHVLHGAQQWLPL